MLSTFIDPCAALVNFLDGLPDCRGQPPSPYFDLEGNNFSRRSTSSLITILVKPQEKVYLIDVTRLKRQTFETKSSSGLTLEDVFQSDDISKVFFNIRNDSDALFSLYDVHIKDFEDLQLQGVASSSPQQRCVNSLAKCIERDSIIRFADRVAWRRVKEQVRRLFDPELGGSYAIFDKRPL